MCGRYTLTTRQEEMAREFLAQFLAEEIRDQPPRYNITPGTDVVAVRPTADGTGREAVALRWGLVPGWATDEAIGGKLTNARSETVAEKPAFRAAFRARRCLLPANGFYEWKRAGGSPQPYYFSSADGSLLALAGLWECRIRPDGTRLATCTVLTTGPNALMAPIHDRLPVILAPEDRAEWLEAHGPAVAGLARLFAPYPSERLRRWPVSPQVNSSRAEGPHLLTPVPEPAPTPVQGDLFPGPNGSGG